MIKEQLIPTTITERIQSIDIIRGLAILGIFLVNMPSFYSPILYLNPSKWWDRSIDVWTNQLIDILAQASFYTLFSFLFGFGMILFKERALAKGYSFYPIITRRLFVLLVLGCIHAFLIWHGDILITYAIIGAIFLMFHKSKPITLLIWSLCLIVVPTILLSGLMFLATMLEPSIAAYPYNDVLAAQSVSVYSEGNFLEVTAQRFQDWNYTNNLENGFFMILAILPMFLLGAFIAKTKWFEEVEVHLKKVKIVWLISVVIGVPIKLLPYIVGKNPGTEYLQDMIGGPATALAYATTIVLLCRSSMWKKILSPLAYVGRLSLSNYLFQSIVCSSLFYGYGFGLYASIKPFYGFLLTIAIFVIQVFISRLWLNNFMYGPVEWLWRTLTYGKRFTIKKNS